MITHHRNILSVRSLLLSIPRDVEIGLPTILKKAAFLVERYSKKIVPVDTGRLRTSINTTVSGLTATISPTVDYAIFVHEGTRYMAGRPFMINGLNQAESEINSIVQKEIKRILKT